MSRGHEPYIPPEYLLADSILSSIPRLGDIDEKKLQNIVGLKSQGNKDYWDVALKTLLKEGYIVRNGGVGISNSGPAYSLTDAGRTLKDKQGFIQHILEKREKESDNEKAVKADGEKKIFDNKVKFVLLGITILTAVVGILGKCVSDAGKAGAPAQAQAPVKQDSVAKQVQQPRGELVSVKKHRIKSPVSQPGVSQSAASQPAVEAPTNGGGTVVEPLQVATADDIVFKLVRAVGSVRAQMVTLTLTLTTSAANSTMSSAVHSVFDGEGNEYRLKSFLIGAENLIPTINLTTGVPIKCTYSFGGVLPAVKALKLFSFIYYKTGAGRPSSLEFRDIPIDWK